MFLKSGRKRELLGEHAGRIGTRILHGPAPGREHGTAESCRNLTIKLCESNYYTSQQRKTVFPGTHRLCPLLGQQRGTEKTFLLQQLSLFPRENLQLFSKRTWPATSARHPRLFIFLNALHSEVFVSCPPAFSPSPTGVDGEGFLSSPRNIPPSATGRNIQRIIALPASGERHSSELRRQFTHRIEFPGEKTVDLTALLTIT